MEILQTTTKIKKALAVAGATLALGGAFALTGVDSAEASELKWTKRDLTEIQSDISEVKESDSIEYQIQWGDTLGNIAEAVGVDLHTLANANGIGNINVIIAGQYLLISEDAQGHTQVEVNEEATKPVTPQVTEKAPVEQQAPVEQAKPEPKPEPAPQPVETVAQPVQATTSAHEAFNQVVAEKGVSQSEANHWAELIRRESNWQVTVSNSQGSGAYGLPQALPGSKMASHGENWRTDPVIQLRWMYDYVMNRYQGSLANAIEHHNANNWY